MGDMNFTEEQQSVIDARGSSLLVSAAAGSGKTAVLVSRIISLITDRDDPVDIDHLLIVTFTKAAAAEMRERIADAVLKLLEKDPDNRRLAKQESLIQNAQITTIDSFSLYVVRNNFSAIDLEPGFRPMDEGERKLMLSDAVSGILEDEYEKNDPEFLNFIESYVTGSSEKTVEDMMLSLLETALSEPRPEKWLMSALEKNEKSMSDAEDSVWLKLAYDKGTGHLKRCYACASEAEKLSRMTDGPSAYTDACVKLVSISENALSKDGFEARVEYLQSIEAPSLRGARGKKNEDPDIRERAKAFIDRARDELKEAMNIFGTDTAGTDRELLLSSRNVSELIRLVLKLKERFDAEKREKNLIDFSDMEHFALQILTGDDGKPTPVAEEYREYFRYIFVDEYQDSNMVQEELLHSIARPDGYFTVGDVKQSIYGFRHARPSIFMEKYESYKESGINRRIDLNRNFRSRAEVLDFVNDIFENIMHRNNCGIEYDDKARLYNGADYYPAAKGDEFKAEILRFYKPNDKEDDALADKVKEYEALICTLRIKQLMESGFMVFDKDNKQMRPVRYSDIVILVRSRGYEDTLKTYFDEFGMPLYYESAAGYFDTLEIKLIMNALKVVDDPDQDIPLYGTLTGLLELFDDEGMAELRGITKKENCSLYEAVKISAEGLCDVTEEIREASKSFIKWLSEFRKYAVTLGIRELIEKMVAESSLKERMTALPGGLGRRADIGLLLERASAFEETSYHGLFRFVRYINELKDRDVDYGEAPVLDEKADVVRIMTIHKSKGLEFPVVVIPGLSSAFRFSESRAPFIADSDMGIAMKAIDTKERLVKKGLKYTVFASKKRMDAIAEEMRVLYVALTRAKEKLILADVDLYGKNSTGPEIKEVPDALSFADMIRYALLFGNASQAGYVKNISETDIAEYITGLDKTAVDRAVPLLEGKLSVDDVLYREYTRKKEYTYGFASLKGLFAKTTVSELKKANRDIEDIESGETFMYPDPEEESYIPSFISGGEKRAAETGTAFHRVMELIPFGELPDDLGGIDGSEIIKSVIRKETASGRLSASEAEDVDSKKAAAFLKDPLAARMVAAAKRGKLYREQPFFFAVPADRFDKGFPSDEDILVQGVIDAFFEEDGKLILLDYKTDRVRSSDRLISRYHRQLEIYADALSQIRGMEVSERLIYSFALQTCVRL